MPPLRTLIVDDSRPFREAVEGFLCGSELVEVAGVAASGSEALDLATRLRPELVLMDLAMPGIDGLEATRRLVVGDAPPLVLVMSVHDQEEYREAARQAGAAGFVLKGELDVTLLPLVASLRGG